MKNAELYRRLVAVLLAVGRLARLTVFVLERTPVLEKQFTIAGGTAA
jgi:hypothetical protein